jgi:anti-anti-sigma regulatory factor
MADQHCDCGDMSTRRPLSTPQNAALTEVVDMRRGAVRASGHLTVQGADLLRGTVETLHRDGHSTVLLDLQDLRAADEAGLQVLRNVRESMAAKGGELFVLASASGATSRL